MSDVRTSESSPIGVNWLPGDLLAGLTGKVGLTFAPGKHAYSKSGARWERDLPSDLDRLVNHHQAAVLVCLLEDHELDHLKIPNLVREAESRGLDVFRLPIPDGGVLPSLGPVKELIDQITLVARSGKNVVVHCAGGLGRTGTIAGCMLVEHGSTAAEAIETLHRVRSRNCPETSGQERFIAEYEQKARTNRRRPAPTKEPDRRSISGSPTATPLRPRQSQVVGAVLGAAIGDAMGHPTEFIKSFDGIWSTYGTSGVTKYELFWGEGQDRFAPYTDDTQMAEAVLRGLLEGREAGGDLDATMRRIAARFIEWEKTPQGGHRAPGNACRQGCKAMANGTHWSEAGDKEAGGCGSVMRAYPFGIVFADDPVRAEAWSVAHSLMTHGHAMATSSCAAMAVGMALVLRGEAPLHVASEMVAAACRHSPKTAGKMTRAIDEALTSVEPGVTLQRLLGWRGDEAIAAAVYIFLRHPNDPRSAILEGTNTPGDSDSLATLAGALVGARCGIESFPLEWVDQLERTEALRELALSIK